MLPRPASRCGGRAETRSSRRSSSYRAGGPTARRCLCRARRGGVTVSSRLFPFAWSTVAEDGGPGASGRIPAGNEPYYENDPWVGTGVFALDSGFVQVLADLASDRRHLVIYDSSGAFRRRRAIDVPFGILDTVPDRRQLLALRRTDRVKILTYEWTWQPRRAGK